MRILTLESNEAGCGEPKCTAKHYNSKLFLEKNEIEDLKPGRGSLTPKIQATYQQRIPAGGVVKVAFAMQCPCCEVDTADILGIHAEVNIPPVSAN